MIAITETAEEQLGNMLDGLDRDIYGIRVKTSLGCEKLHEISVDKKNGDDEVLKLYMPKISEISLFVNRTTMDEIRDSILDYVKTDGQDGEFSFYYTSSNFGQITQSLISLAFDYYTQYRSRFQRIFEGLNFEFFEKEDLDRLTGELWLPYSNRGLSLTAQSSLYKTIASVVENAEEAMIEFYGHRKFLQKLCDDSDMSFESLVEEWKNLDKELKMKMLLAYGRISHVKENAGKFKKPTYLG